MNIFAAGQGILGDTGYARQHNTFHAFLTLARSIRKQLGARAYKLDEYIRQLLIACPIRSKKNSLTGRVRRRAPWPQAAGWWRWAENRKVRRQMDAIPSCALTRRRTPLQNQVDNTRSLIYFCSLLDDHLAMGMETMIQDIWSGTAGRMDTVLADALFQGICALLGQEEEMMRPNALFAQRFLSVPLRHFAWQIAANELARALLERDPETSCEIIHLLLASE